MKLIVGLGNPGIDYEKTRHNAGFMVVDRAAKRFAPGGIPRSKHGGAIIEAEIAGEKTFIFKPLGFMNRCGGPVAELAGFFKLSPATDLLVVVDDYNLPLGTLRIREGGSDGNHNGLTDLIRALGTQQFPRLRVGIDQKPATYDDPSDWVLGKFSPEQLSTLEPSLNRACDAIEAFVRKGTTAAMNVYNATDKPVPDKPVEGKPAAAKPAAAKPAAAKPARPLSQGPASLSPPARPDSAPPSSPGGASLGPTDSLRFPLVCK